MAGRLTWVDFMIADHMQIFPLISEEFLKPFPRLVQHQKRIYSFPELQDYLYSDRYMERPCNSARAYWK